MKLAILAVCLLGFLMLECHSSPVQLVENYELASKARALGRQAAATGVAPAAAAAVPAADEDDDDEDEDDDDDEGLEDIIDDDDDDDDEEEDDDDDDDVDTPQGQAAPGAAPVAAASDDDDEDGDDDYIDRIFDDILGDDDDDDDDDEDEPSPAAAVAPAQAAAAPAKPAKPAAVAPVQPAAAAAAAAEVIEEAASEGENVIVSGTEEVVEGEQNVFYDEENPGIDTKVDIQSLNVKPLESTTAKVAVAAPVVAASAVESSDDDDDDDDDDITGAFTGDDDEEDDDDTEDDDDDDDDIVGDDVIEARRAREAEKNVIIEMPKDAFQERHNQFIDAIFARINHIVSDSYDPFKVRLASVPKQATKAKPNTPSKANKTSTKSKTKKVAGGSKTRSNADAVAIGNATTTEDVKSPATIMSYLWPTEELQQREIQAVGAESAEKRTVSSLSPSTGTKNKKKIQPLRSNANKQQTTKQQKPKQTNPNSSAVVAAAATPPPSQSNSASVGSLSGLASLRRVGNAKVVTDPEGRNSTIKSKFTLGPLTLKVEKSFKRGNVRNVKTATAHTNEMIGRIKFSVVNDQATLVSIKVQQPKQVKVESKDNHDRTREIVWRRTPKIARLVSEKLRLAAESLFQPRAGVEVVRL